MLRKNLGIVLTASVLSTLCAATEDHTKISHKRKADELTLSERKEPSKIPRLSKEDFAAVNILLSLKDATPVANLNKIQGSLAELSESKTPSSAALSQAQTQDLKDFVDQACQNGKEHYRPVLNAFIANVSNFNSVLRYTPFRIAVEELIKNPKTSAKDEKRLKELLYRLITSEKLAAPLAQHNLTKSKIRSTIFSVFRTKFKEFNDEPSFISPPKKRKTRRSKHASSKLTSALNATSYQAFQAPNFPSFPKLNIAKLSEDEAGEIFSEVYQTLAEENLRISQLFDPQWANIPALFTAKEFSQLDKLLQELYTTRSNAFDLSKASLYLLERCSPTSKTPLSSNWQADENDLEELGDELQSFKDKIILLNSKINILEDELNKLRSLQPKA